MFVTIRGEGRRAFPDSSVTEFGLEYFEHPETRKLVEPWGTPQRDDYDFVIGREMRAWSCCKPAAFTNTRASPPSCDAFL